MNMNTKFLCNDLERWSSLKECESCQRTMACDIRITMLNEYYDMLKDKDE